MMRVLIVAAVLSFAGTVTLYSSSFTLYAYQWFNCLIFYSLIQFTIMCYYLSSGICVRSYLYMLIVVFLFVFWSKFHMCIKIYVCWSLFSSPKLLWSFVLLLVG